MDKTDSKDFSIETRLEAAGWCIQDPKTVDLNQSLGVVIRNFPLARDYGAIDYLLHLKGKAVGLIEISPENIPLTGVPVLDEKYSRGLPFTLRVFMRPLPFLYQSNGNKTCFTNAFDPDPKPRPVRGFHRPETLESWLEDGMVGETPRDMAAEHFPEHRRRGRSFHERLLINMPPLETDGLSTEQIRMMNNLEQSFRENRLRALVDLPAGPDRTLAAIRFAERLIRFADARRVLFLVNSAGIGRRLAQTMQDILSPDSGISVQHLTGKTLDTEARFCITTLPRLHGLLTNQPGPNTQSNQAVLPPVPYHPDFPIETFDLVIIDTCNASVTGYFRPVLEYFDAYLIGLTEKADSQAGDFFDRNLVMDESKKENETDGLDMISFDSGK